MESKTSTTREKLIGIVAQIAAFAFVVWLAQFIPVKVRPLVATGLLFALCIAVILFKRQSLPHSMKILFFGLIIAFAILTLWQLYAFIWDIRLPFIGVLVLVGIPVAVYLFVTRCEKQKGGGKSE